MYKKIFIAIVLVLISTALFAQDRFEIIEKKLYDLSQNTPGLNEKVDLSVNDVSIQEFIRGLANANNINISVDPSLNTTIVSNYSGVTVKDVLFFLCKKYDLDLSIIGS